MFFFSLYCPISYFLQLEIRYIIHAFIFSHPDYCNTYPAYQSKKAKLEVCTQKGRKQLWLLVWYCIDSNSILCV